MAGPFVNPFTPAGGAHIEGMPAPAQVVQPGSTAANINNKDATSMLNPDGSHKSTQDLSDLNDANQSRNGNTDLVDFEKMWEPKQVDPKAPTKPTTYLPTIDPKQVAAQVANLDFTKNIKPEQAAAIVAGGEGALAAFKELLNDVGRQAVTVGFKATNVAVERGLDTAKGRFLEEVPNHVNTMLADSNLRQDNPLMASPKYRAVVSGIRAQIQEANPNLDANQLNKETRRYFDEMISDSQPKANNNGAPQVDKNGRTTYVDGSNSWDDWADAPVASN